MTMHARHIAAALPADLDEVFGLPAARAPAPAPININGPSLVVVVPDKVGAILGVCGKAGVKGGSNLLWTLGLMLLVAL